VPGGWPRPNSEETYPLWVFTMTGVFEKALPCEGEQMREFYAGLPKPVPDKNEEVFRAVFASVKLETNARFEQKQNLKGIQ
jgi:hypothetical protein